MRYMPIDTCYASSTLSYLLSFIASIKQIIPLHTVSSRSKWLQAFPPRSTIQQCYSAAQWTTGTQVDHGTHGFSTRCLVLGGGEGGSNKHFTPQNTHQFQFTVGIAWDGFSRFLSFAFALECIVLFLSRILSTRQIKLLTWVASTVQLPHNCQIQHFAAEI